MVDLMERIEVLPETQISDLNLKMFGLQNLKLPIIREYGEIKFMTPKIALKVSEIFSDFSNLIVEYPNIIDYLHFKTLIHFEHLFYIKA